MPYDKLITRGDVAAFMADVPARREVVKARNRAIAAQPSRSKVAKVAKAGRKGKK